MSGRAEFERHNPVPDSANWNEKKQGYYWSNYPTVAHLFNDKWEVWQAAVEWQANRAQGVTVPMKPIAESKVRQLGGDVCGVLVRKDDRLAAVDEHGRVQWLQDRQGISDSRAEFEKWYDEATDCNYGVAYYVDINGRYCFPDIEIAWQAWQAARAQQGSVPEGHVAIPKDVAAAKGMYLVGYSWLKHNAPDELTTPQPEGDEWVSSFERAPTKSDADFSNRVIWWEATDDTLQEFRPVVAHYDPNWWEGGYFEDFRKDIAPSHPFWKPTGLKRPQPPQEGSGDE